jgi:ribonuclease P protein component
LKNDLSFPRNQRLVTKAEYKSIFGQSDKASQRYLLALYKPNTKDSARLGVIVGKRVANSAVVRNQIKRVVRESFRANQKQLIGLDIVVIARQQCDSLDKVQLREGIEKLWQKLITQYRRVSP